MRTLSLNFRQALFAQESGELPVFLLTITHPDLAVPIRLSSDSGERLSVEPLRYGTVSRGETFYFVGMDITLPDEQDGSPPASKMIISNVDRELIPTARSVLSPAQVKLEAVLASAPDDVEFEIPALDMVHLNYDLGQLTFDLMIDSLASEPFASGSFDPASFPGLFS